MTKQGKLAILVGGGPAPGINSVISAATIRSLRVGVEVVGIYDGFSNLRTGKFGPKDWIPLTRDSIVHIHFEGGSILRISRASPADVEGGLENTVKALLELGVDKLITIGGDGTACCAQMVEKVAAGRLRVVHVPKTIDNDMMLPAEIDTFGYKTARHVGCQIVKNLMTDAKTTSRWYFVIAMGRKAGHLALGIGKAAGATLTLIPEEWPEEPLPFRWIVDTLACSILKRGREGRRYGTAVIAEGMLTRLSEEDLAQVDGVEREANGRLRLSEAELGFALKSAVKKRLEEWGIEQSIVATDIGYELRCADPIPSDMSYCQDLGYCAAKFVILGGNAAVVSIQAGHFEPIPFQEVYDETTGLACVRLVDITSNQFRIALRYMTRMVRQDFMDEAQLHSLLRDISVTPEDFYKDFSYIVKHEATSPPMPGVRDYSPSPS